MPYSVCVQTSIEAEEGGIRVVYSVFGVKSQLAVSCPLYLDDLPRMSGWVFSPFH